jgi:hypothetical protein
LAPLAVESGVSEGSAEHFIAVESGVSEGSAKHFMSGKLFVKMNIDKYSSL